MVHTKAMSLKAQYYLKESNEMDNNCGDISGIVGLQSDTVVVVKKVQ